MSLRSWDDLVIRAVVLDFRRANEDQSTLRKRFTPPVSPLCGRILCRQASPAEKPGEKYFINANNSY